MGDFLVKVNFNSIPILPGKVAAGASSAVSKAAGNIEASAKNRAPSKSGRLRDSISTTSSGLSASINVEAEYAAEVEFGSSTTPAQPFLLPASGDEEALLEAQSAAILADALE